MTKKWRFRDDMLGHYINSSSNRTFQDAEDRLNHLEEKAQLPDMREKVKEYIAELDKEINKYHIALEESGQDAAVPYTGLVVRIQTLTDVKNDLQSRLEELV